MSLKDRMTVSSSNGRVLIVGATGFIGQFIADSSLSSGRPTYVLHRSAAHSKPKVVKALQDKGALIIHGDVSDREVMEKLLRENKIEIVISAVGGLNILQQLCLIEAIQAVGTVKRFFPSEFGHDVDRAEPVEPGINMYQEKRLVRRRTEELGVPYTYICCNSIASWPYYDNTHPTEVLPPLDRLHIYGDGSVKAYFIAGTDIGKFTMKTVDDPRTLNASVHFRPRSNCYNMNDLSALWEKKIGRTLPRVTISEDDLLAVAAENEIPRSIVASFTHDIFIKGCQVNFSIEGPGEVEVTELYPAEPFRTLDDCFSEFAVRMEMEMEMRNKEKPTKEITSKAPMVEPFSITATCA